MGLDPQITDLGSKVRLDWTPDLSGQGYRLYVDGVAVSRTFRPTAKTTEFSKPDAEPHRYGVQKMDVVDALEEVTWPVPPQPSGAYIYDTFQTDFSKWDTREAHVAQGGVKIVDVASPWGPKSCRVNCSQSYASGSTTGATTNLWVRGPNGNYSLPWMQEGAKTFFHLGVLFPNGTDPRYPGKIAISPGDGVSSPWHIFQEWHKNDDDHAPGPTSTKTELSQKALLHKTLGGKTSPKILWWYETDQVQNETNGIGGQSSGPIGGTPLPIKFNHWYSIVTYIEFSPDPTKGLIEWYVDSVLRARGKWPTMPQRSDGVTPGLSWQAGMYRDNAVGGTHGDEQLYIGLMAAGPTRASVAA